MSRNMKIIGGLLAITLTATAGADLVDSRFTGTGLGRNVKINHDGSSMNVFAGQLTHEVAAPVGHWFESGDYITYCIEITETVSNSFNPASIEPLTQAPNSAAMGLAKAQILADLLTFAGEQPFTTVSNNANRDFAAAFQIMVWEIVYDFDGTMGSLDPTAGELLVQNTSGGSLSSGINNAFTALALGATQSAGSGSLSSFGAIVSAGVQDQVTLVPGPAALALLGFGLVAIRLRRPAS